MRISYVFALLLLSVGCADRSTVDVPVSHPANPDAAEAARPAGSMTPAPSAEAPPASMIDHSEHASAADAPAARPTPVVHAHGDAAALVADDFTCQMHPRVSQPEPGRCPICHMTLKPRSQLKDAP